MAKEIEEPRVKVKKGEAPMLQEKEAMRTFTDSAEIFQLMESRDEGQMMQAVLGVYSKEYVYDIPFKGEGGREQCDTPNCSLATRKIKHTHVRGLSWSGIKEARRIFQGIDTQQVSKPQVVDQDGLKLWECSATAIDLRTGNSTTVHKRQSFLKKTKGGLIEDPFAYEIVQSKAKRNAIAELLPQPLVRAWIKDWTAGKKDFDIKHAVNLEKGRDYKVNDDTKTVTKGTPEPKGLPEHHKPTELQFRKVYAQWHEIEQKGGESFADAREGAKKSLNVKSLNDITRQQLSEIIDGNVKYLAKLTAKKESQPEVAKEPEDVKDKVKLIKDTLIELGWFPGDLALTAMLKTHSVSSLDELDKASSETLDAILADLG